MFEWTIRLLLAAWTFSTAGLVIFMLTEGRVMGSIDYKYMGAAWVLAAAAWVGAMVTARRSTRLVLERYGFPYNLGSTLKTKMLNDTALFDAWLAGCQSQVANDPRSQAS